SRASCVASLRGAEVILRVVPKVYSCNKRYLSQVAPTTEYFRYPANHEVVFGKPGCYSFPLSIPVRPAAAQVAWFLPQTYSRCDPASHRSVLLVFHQSQRSCQCIRGYTPVVSSE